MPVDLNEEHVLLFDSAGVEMAVSNGVAVPVGTRGYIQAGTDGANVRFRLLDASGRGIAVGAAAAGAAVAGNPVLMAGTDGTNVRAILTDTTGRVATTSTAGTPAIITGEVSTNATTRAAINLTAYTDQSTNAQRSVSSASANDTAAGTGARTIRLTYYSIAAGVVTGPFTETITMNGVTAVNTVSTTIAFVEKIEVITVGSLGASAGIISIFAAAAGAGGAFGTMTASTTITRWSQHWVPSGKTCSIYSVYLQNDAASGNSPRITIDVFDVATANAAERAVATYRVDGRSSIALAAQTPIVVVGPARLRAYVTPQNSAVQLTTFEARYTEV
ncbi:MAG: hypothetical protein ACREJC_06555 [Tepidisphaeraceae bacterium]